MYAQLHTGPGAAASAVPAQRWADIASDFAAITRDLAKAVTEARTGWQGESATSAFTQIGEVAAWADRVSESASSMRLSVEQQADHIGQARANMPAPGGDPSPRLDPAVDPAAQVLALQSDHEPVERATSEAARRAYEDMQTYQNDTTATTEGLTRFDETVDTSAVLPGYDAGRRGGAAASPVSVTPIPSQSTVPRGEQLVSAASADFFALPADEPEVRARPVAAEPLGPGSGAAALPAQRTSTVRRAASRKPVPLDVHPLAPVAPSTGTPGTTSDRVTSRRIGEPLVIAQDGAEPRKRRRDRNELDKITERVEGVDAEVPPPVIGGGPYRP
nr:PPE domain-containing protein [Kibdelosporangium phytohabitans]